MPETIEKKYLRKNGLVCPFCESSAINAASPSADTMQAWAQVSCDQCDAEWNDLYTLVGIEVVSRPKQPVGGC